MVENNTEAISLFMECFECATKTAFVTDFMCLLSILQ